jgi:tellurite resistance protein TehA-like permease
VKRLLYTLVIVLAASAVIAVVIVFIFRHRTHRKTKSAATMNPALVESILTPTASPEVKGTFDQKTRLSPSPH